MKILMRLFISNIVASSRRVPVLRSGSLIRSNAAALLGEFSSFSSTKWLGLRLKNAFSELENSADSPRNTKTIITPKRPANTSDPTAKSACCRRMKTC